MRLGPLDGIGRSRGKWSNTWRRTIRRSAMAGYAGLTLAVLAAGCQSPAVAGRTQQRLDAIHASLEKYQRQESGRTEKLRAAGSGIAADVQEDAASLRADWQWLCQKIWAEFEEWQAKQPQMRSAIQQEWEDRPERMEQTLPMLF